MEAKYKTVEERMVHTYLDTFPSFVPSERGPGVTAQKQFYQFIAATYARLMEEPELLVNELHEDDAYNNRFNKKQDNKPKLQDHMRKMVKQVDALLAALFELGKSGQVVDGSLVVDKPVGKKQQPVLERLGLRLSAESGQAVYRHDEYGELFAAWKWMACRPDASLLAFSRCMFRQDYPYSSQIYARLSGNETSFGRLEDYLLGHGYTCMDNLDGRVSVDYVKRHGDTGVIKGGFEYGIRHTGVSARYDILVKEPQVFGLCIPRMKDMLAAFETMPESVQAFVISRTKRCDGCRYCVQTDKSGKRPLANMRIHYGGKDLRLCPYYPGYRYCWSHLDDALVDNLIGMLAFMDRLLDGE